MAFEHGVSLKFSDAGPVSVGEIPSGVIGLVGIAPKGPLNSLTVVQNDTDASQFGAQVPGFTIAQSLDAIFKQNPGSAIVVINVFDPATHVTAVAAEQLVLVNGKGKSAFPYVGAMVVKNQAGTGPAFVKDTDYSIDDYGNITSLNYTNIAAGATVQLTYSKPNLAAITGAVINGTVTGSVRTGLKLLENAYNDLGFEPKILIAPGFSVLNVVTAELAYWANRLYAQYIVDAPTGTSVSVAKTGRGPAGAINFNTSDKNAILAFPEVKAYSPSTDSYIASSFSPFLAGLMSRVDKDQGYWKSPSNEPINGILGPAVPLSGSPFTNDNDAYALNALGIVTMINRNGWHVWGNRNASFPINTALSNFIPLWRTAQIIGRSLQIAALQYVDKPATLVFIDQIRETGQGYINELIGRGALLDGSKVIWNSGASDRIAGKLVYDIVIAGPTPAESILFNVVVDSNIVLNNQA